MVPNCFSSQFCRHYNECLHNRKSTSRHANGRKVDAENIIWKIVYQKIFIILRLIPAFDEWGWFHWNFFDKSSGTFVLFQVLEIVDPLMKNQWKKICQIQEVWIFIPFQWVKIELRLQKPNQRLWRFWLSFSFSSWLPYSKDRHRLIWIFGKYFDVGAIRYVNV